MSIRSLLAAAFILTLGLGLFALSQTSAVSQGPKTGPTLPGALAIVNATNYPSLQSAIDAVPATGGVVRLPPGTFEISRPLVITQEDILIEGCGTATHIHNASQDGQPAIIVQSAKLKENPKAVIWRVRLANFRLTGNEKSRHGLLATQVNEIFVEGVTISNHGGDGLRLDQCYEDPRICDSLITYNKATGLNLLGCHDIVVVGNQFEENQDAVRCTDGFNLCLSGNCIDDHLGNGVVIENTYGSVVSGNMIEECNGTGIVLDRDCYGITLSANVIAHETGGGIDLRDAHGCAVTGNSFPLVKKNAVVIGPKSARITVTGNAFSNSYIGEGDAKRTKINDDAASGVVLSGTRDVVISANVFSDLTGKSLTAVDPASRRLIYSDNLQVNSPADREKLIESSVSGNLE